MPTVAEATERAARSIEDGPAWGTSWPTAAATTGRTPRPATGRRRGWPASPGARRSRSRSRFDRALRTVVGSGAVDLVAGGRFGRLVVFTGRGIDSMPLDEAVERIRKVSPDGAMVRAGSAIGASFGDDA